MELMKGALANVVEAVGNTPIVRLNSVIPEEYETSVYTKLEYLNPGGSVKDRPAIQIINDAEEEGKLKPGGTIVEATSGNTGMGLAMVSATRGYKCIFVMPDKMSNEKIKALRAVGARVVICPTNVAPEDPQSYYSVARQITEDTPNSMLADQYFNPSNPKAHALDTGPEIWEQTAGELDAIVICMGTGGTISGLGKFLKGKKPELKVIGVDPVGSVFYDYFHTGKMVPAHSYKVEGFGEDFLPGTMDFGIVDSVVRVTDKECFLMTRRLAREEGLLCGGSSGAVVAGALSWAERYGKGKHILTILPDGASKYMSKIFDDTWMRENGYLQPELEARISDLVGKRGQELVTASPDESVRSIIGRMKEYGISQLPVLEDQKLVGLITEGDLLHSLVDAQVTPESQIENLIDMNFAIVEPGNSISLLAQIFNQGKIAVVVDRSTTIGVVTKIDLIDYITSGLN